MPDYRAHIVGPDGSIIGEHLLPAVDQTAAVTKAISLLNGHALEIWNGDKHIGTLKPGVLGGSPYFKRRPKTPKQK